MRKVFILLTAFLLFSNIVMAEEQGNPFLEAWKEILSWTQENAVGLSGVVDDGLLLTASVQLAKSKHDWLHLGFSVKPADTIENCGAGGYIGFNLGRLIEKVKGSELEIIQTLDVGYSAIKEFRGDWDENWRRGLFGLFLKKEI